MDSKSNQKILDRVKNLQVLSSHIAKETDLQRLYEVILESLQELTNADGGVLYSLAEEKSKLKSQVLIHRTLDIRIGGTSPTPTSFDDLYLYDSKGSPNYQYFACYSALKDEVLNIPDVYLAHHFELSRIKKFDKLTGYRTKSTLNIPVKNHEHEVIGVVQLFNARDAKGEFVAFSKEDETFASYLCAWAGETLTNYFLKEDLRKLFESIVQVMASAVDDKSSYTGEHCRRVPIIAMMIADALVEADYGPLKDFKLTKEDRYELELAALLHDCGKVTTPTHIMDKATKLETIFDRIELIDDRFEIVLRDAALEVCQEKLKILEKEHSLSPETASAFKELDQKFLKKKLEMMDDRDFIRRSNVGGEYMSKELQNRIREIGEKYPWKNADGISDQFLTFDEIKNLIISRGTLTEEEREIINHHAEMTLKMLSQMHFPSHLKRIPEIASCHHERINGKGYPRGLKGEEMSVQAKLMCVADIFEALTAKDRPYKKGKTLTETLSLMGKMRMDNHIDGDIFDIFMDKKVYLAYAKKFLDDYQIDEVDLSKLPGYTPPEKRKKTQDKDVDWIMSKENKRAA